MKRLGLLAVTMLVGMAFMIAVSVAGAQSAKSSDLLSGKQVQQLVANAKTPADHLKLQKHFLALAAKYEADAADHEALAPVYRKNPGPSESKRPGSPDTAVHCDRFAQSARDAAKEARELASAHEHMAAAK